MNKIENGYRYLSADQLMSLGLGERGNFSVVGSFNNPSNNERKELDLGDKNPFLCPSTEDLSWNIEDNGIMLLFSFTISACEQVFSPFLLAYPDSEIAVACHYSCNKSRIQKTIFIVPLKKQGDQNITYELSIAPHFIASDVSISFELVLAKAGRPNGIQGVCNIPGVLLGILSEFKLIAEGDGALFPVDIIKDPSADLWSLDLSFSDASELLNETVRLRLNSDHPNYKNIADSNSSDYWPRLAHEIEAETLAIFICQALDCVKGESDPDMSEGTIGEAFTCLKKRFNIQSNNVDDIFQKVRSGVMEVKK